MSIAVTPKVIQRLLTSRQITAHVAHRMQTLFGHILRNSVDSHQADIEAEKYFKGLDGRFRPFFSSLVLCILLPLLGYAQTSLPSTRWEKADSLIFQGDSTVLQVYPNQDSVVITDASGNMTFLTDPKAVLFVRSPETENIYGAYVFGKYGDSTIIIEYFYNARKKLWGTCLTFEGSWILEGMQVIQPFPPLRPPPTVSVRPIMARR